MPPRKRLAVFKAARVIARSPKGGEAISDKNAIASLPLSVVAMTKRFFLGPGQGMTFLTEDIVYAIIRTGGKQHMISPGDTIRVEKLEGQVGDAVEMKEVLLYADGENVLTGKPLLFNVKVVGEIMGQRRAKKVIVFKMKRRKGYQKRQGHRQSFTSLRIKEISLQ